MPVFAVQPIIDADVPAAADLMEVRPRWAEGSRLLGDYLNSITLKDLCDQGQEMGLEKELDHRFMYFI